MKEFWNQRYSEEGHAYGSAPNDFLEKNFHLLKKNGRILCLAEGEGRNALFLARKGFSVTAVDFSEVGISKLLKAASLERLPIDAKIEDMEDFDMGKSSWDGIISIFAHLQPAIRKKVHQNIQEALKDQGLLILEAYRPEQIERGTGGPTDKNMMMNINILHEELPALTPVFESEAEREIYEGKYHNGLSSVVQFIGRK